MFRTFARTASCRGIRKFRPYPSLTLTISPAFPSFSTSSRRMIFIGEPLPDLRGGECDQRENPRLLDLHRQLPLVLRAVPRDAAGDDLPPLGDELLDHVRVLVVDRELFLRAEAAELLADVPLLPSSGRAAMIVAPGTGRRGAGLVRGAHRVFPPWNPDRIFSERDIVVLRIGRRSRRCGRLGRRAAR